MKKRRTNRFAAIILAMLMLVSMVPSFSVNVSAATISAEGGTADDIIASIPVVYEEAKKIANRSSFDGYCGAYVRCQMIALGIISKSTTGMGNGKDQFDYWKNKTTTDCGFNVVAYPASKYSILNVLNAVSNNGTKNAYNILIGFEWTNYGDGKTYGHVMFIRAIINGTVYYTESSHWNINGGTDEGHLITCNFSKFCDRYSSANYTFDGGIHFFSSSPTPYSSISTGNYNLVNKGNGGYLHVQSAGDSNGQSVVTRAGALDEKADTFYIYSASDGYKMRPACSSSRIVNAWGDSPSSGAKITLYDDMSNSTQWWKFEAVSGGYIIHLAYNTSLVITQVDNQLSLQPRTGASNQIWTLEAEHKHSYQTTWSTSSTQHWHECSCGDKKDTANHVYDNACDTTCNTCGYVRTITHSYSTVWSKDATKHWHECSVCHDKTDIAEHSFDKNGVCTECGYKTEQQETQSTLSSETAASGETVTLTLSLNENLLAASGGIEFILPNGFEIVSGSWKYKGPEYNDDGDEALNIVNFKKAEGRGAFAYDSNSYIIGDNIFELKVKIPEDCEEGTYTVSYNLTVTNPERQNYSIKQNNAVITVRNYVPGDIDGVEGVSADDAIYLLYNIFFPTKYPVSQPIDFDGDGDVTADDAIYLLYHVFFEDKYPLK